MRNFGREWVAWIVERRNIRLEIDDVTPEGECMLPRCAR